MKRTFEEQVLKRLGEVESRVAALERTQRDAATPANDPVGDPAPWDGDWSTLPATLKCRHMAAIKGVKVDAIYDRLQHKTMRPKPDSWLRPYSWQKARVIAELRALAQ
jgi:hypothetical protein